MHVLKSATKIVLVILTIALVPLTYLGIVESKDFVMLVSMVFMAYFKNSQTSADKSE